jgi:hypothetical protein
MLTDEEPQLCNQDMLEGTPMELDVKISQTLLGRIRKRWRKSYKRAINGTPGKEGEKKRAMIIIFWLRYV